MSPPVLQLVKILFDPDVSKTLILKMAFNQLKAIGLARILAFALGGLLVAGSSCIKVPQILKIVRPELIAQRKAVANGLSLQSLSIDTFNQLILVVFNSQNNIPFVNYGESLLLSLQNVAIIILVNYYRLENVDKLEKLPLHQKLVAAGQQLTQPIAVIAATALFFTKFAPTNLVALLQILNIPLSILSKIPQIQNNSRLQSTSHLSDITIRANVIGGAIRVFTSIQNLKQKKRKSLPIGSDLVLLAGYTTSLALSGVVVGQSIVYKKKEEEKKDV